MPWAGGHLGCQWDPSGELFPEAAPCSGATVTLALCPPQPDLTRCCPSDAVFLIALPWKAGSPLVPSISSQ